MNHIRVFRRIEHGQGRPRFEIRSFTGHTGSIHDTIGDAARAAKAAATAHGHAASVHIEFRPEHDIEWPVATPCAYRCEALNARERHEFYEAFVSKE